MKIQERRAYFGFGVRDRAERRRRDHGKNAIIS